MNENLLPTFSSFIRESTAESEPLAAVFRRLREPSHAPVFNFAIGQPSVEHTPAIQSALDRVVADPRTHLHQYPPTAGLTETRIAVAALINRHHQRGVTAEDVMMTVGAAGALHVIFRTLLDPGDEVVTAAPFFGEYKYYCGNYGARLVVAAPRPRHVLDAQAIAAVLTPRTKVVLLNSPNNPAGTAYSKEELADLQRVLDAFGRQHRRTIVVVSDETYHRVHYGETQPASPWVELHDSILVGSFSKDLGLAGERIGYLALSSELAQPALREALAVSQRVLGFVNAPLIWQRVLSSCLNVRVDTSAYRRKRDRLAAVLAAAGLEFTLPDGGVFILARSPLANESAFIEILARHAIVVLPGSLYGAPGFVRASFSVDEAVITSSLGAWQTAVIETLELLHAKPRRSQS